MSLKEKPLLDAVEQSGPLPSVLFANSVFAGFFAMIMCPVFGATFMIFQVAGHGEVGAVELFNAARLGAIGALIFGGFVFLGILVSAFRTPDEARYRYKFAFGGFLGAATLVALDYFFLDQLREYFSTAGPLI